MDVYLLIVLSILGFLTLVNLIFTIFKKCPDYKNELLNIRKDALNKQSNSESILRQEFKNSRDDIARTSRDSQDLLSQRLMVLSDHQSKHLLTFQKQLKELMESNHRRIYELQETLLKSMQTIRTDVGRRLELIQRDNNEQLEKMRSTVDEKLHKTLEERLGKSFELVGIHLEAVQKGLGEMQSLASGVGDLKKVLSNVKTRGVLGEIQLSNILEQIMTHEQYGINIATIPGSRCHVEFALKLPGKDPDGKQVWLPIDSKFPMDKYEHLNDAYDLGDVVAIDQAKKNLISTVKIMAKEIHSKYISPPHTTDFGILFLPIEGLYAEVVRQTGLMEELQRDLKIIVSGPSNLAAFLNSIQMGFRTMAIEQRSSEVWNVLSAVKSEFGKFGSVLDKVQTKLQQATKTIDEVGIRSRAIERNLRKVEVLPHRENASILNDGLDVEELTLMPHKLT